MRYLLISLIMLLVLVPVLMAQYGGYTTPSTSSTITTLSTSTTPTLTATTTIVTLKVKENVSGAGYAIIKYFSPGSIFNSMVTNGSYTCNLVNNSSVCTYNFSPSYFVSTNVFINNGFKFLGWYCTGSPCTTNNSFYSGVNTMSFTLKGNTMLTAIFTKNVVTTTTIPTSSTSISLPTSTSISTSTIQPTTTVASSGILSNIWNAIVDFLSKL